MSFVLPNTLVDVAKSRKLILFFGSGISALGGCLSHKEIIRKFLTYPEVKTYLKQQDIDKNEIKVDFDLFLTRVKEIFKKNPNKYLVTLEKAVEGKEKKLKEQYYPFLEKLKNINPRPSIITTNIDDFICKSGWCDKERRFFLLSTIRDTELGKGGVFHIHGHQNNITNTAWTREDYKKLYQNTKLKQFFKKVFDSSWTVIFMGYDIQKEPLMPYYFASRNNKSPEHYLLVSTDKDRGYNKFHCTEYDSQCKLKVIKYGLRKDFLKIIGNWFDAKFNSPSLSEDKTKMRY